MRFCRGDEVPGTSWSRDGLTTFTPLESAWRNGLAGTASRPSPGEMRCQGRRGGGLRGGGTGLRGGDPCDEQKLATMEATRNQGDGGMELLVSVTPLVGDVDDARTILTSDSPEERKEALQSII